MRFLTRCTLGSLCGSGETLHAAKGIAVVDVIPWTYDLKPALALKELFVHPDAPRSGVGTLLMRRVSRHAIEIGAPRLIWSVLKSNRRGAAFYEALGATKDSVWDAWSLDASPILELGRPEHGNPARRHS